MSLWNRMSKFFTQPKPLTNFLLLLSISLANTYLQVFCRPTLWATILLLVCFIHTIIYPYLLRYKRLHAFLGFINGISFCVFIYCILFLGHLNLLGIILLLVGIGILIYIPYYFTIQLFYVCIIRPASRSVRVSFIAGVLVCCCIVLYIKGEYTKAVAQIERYKRSDYRQLEYSFMTEKILGMHFLYHTRFCEFDGWRPPLHEPILIIGMRLNGDRDPLSITLEKRIELYKKVFPRKSVKRNCSCAISYSDAYHNDKIWKTTP